MFRRMKVVAAATGALLAAAGIGPASAQEKYPSRPIEVIVPFGPGGGADQLARLTAKLVEPVIGQGVPIVNVPGGTGATGMAKLVAAPSDGYSAAIYIADTHALLTAEQGQRWKVDDITPLAIMIQQPSFLFVGKDSPIKSWADLEKAAKDAPGKLKIATVGFGSVDDFTIKHLEAKGGVKLVQVPFSKPNERYVSILGGHADVLYEQAGDVAQFIKSGEMRPILMFGEKRMAEFPDVPASSELGFSVSLPQFRAIVVRSDTPADRIKAMSDALSKIAAADEFRAFLKDSYADPASFVPADKSGGFLKQQLEDMKKASAGS
jgi:tripartite-type tricarboxylate transporter receptor subunit TctC